MQVFKCEIIGNDEITMKDGTKLQLYYINVGKANKSGYKIEKAYSTKQYDKTVSTIRVDGKYKIVDM